MLTEHLPALAVRIRSVLHAAVSPGNSLILAPISSKLQQHFNTTLSENLSDSLHLCDKQERDRTCKNSSIEGIIWGRGYDAAAQLWSLGGGESCGRGAVHER